MYNRFFLFYLHLPKCAGMTLLNYLNDQVGSSNIYQSTSLIQNYWNNKCEYIFMPSPKELRVYFGHWLHEEMLKQTDWRIPYLVTSIRNPIDRFKSQYRYDVKIANENGFKLDAKEEFLERNSNVYTRFLTKTFPTFVHESTNLVNSSIKILQCFDFVYDSVDSNSKIPILAAQIGLEKQNIPNRVNTTDENSIVVPFADQEIFEANRFDMEIYQAFSEAKSSNLLANNPLYSNESREILNSFLCTQYDKQRAFDYLIPPLIEEYNKYGVLKNTLENLKYFLLYGNVSN